MSTQKTSTGNTRGRSGSKTYVPDPKELNELCRMVHAIKGLTQSANEAKQTLKNVAPVLGVQTSPKTLTIDTAEYKAHVTESDSPTKVNVTLLETLIEPSVAKSLYTKVFDKEKFEKKVESGAIPPDVARKVLYTEGTVQRLSVEKK